MSGELVEMLLATSIVLFVAIAIPIFIVLHFVTKWKQSREFTREDEQMLEDLWQLGQRLDERLDTLERILDDEAPPRRRRYETTHLEH